MPTPDDPSAWIAALALADRLNKAQALRRHPATPARGAGYAAVAESIERGRERTQAERHDEGPGILASPIFALYLAAVIVAGAILAII
jgi:hypothetical protein